MARLRIARPGFLSVVDREITETDADMLCVLFSEEATELRRQVMASIEDWLLDRAAGKVPFDQLPDDMAIREAPRTLMTMTLPIDPPAQGLSELELRYLHGDR